MRIAIGLSLAILVLTLAGFAFAEQEALLLFVENNLLARIERPVNSITSSFFIIGFLLVNTFSLCLYPGYRNLGAAALS